MKFFIHWCFQFTLVICFAYQYNCENSTYTTMYDGIDLDEILTNDRLLAGYVNCLLEKGPCTPDGKELKNNLPDAIENDCSKCTERQREGADKVMHYIIDHKPEEWEELEKKYHSDGSYKLNYLLSKQKLSLDSQENKNVSNGDNGDDDDDDNDKDHQGGQQLK
ncbi:ejaculatory bulb-specific protein 3-like [Melitaea cinxia]|uniref:ejaculatory bulb-specific protein 3-like n=1 Tax=Melitaea cinxia TaxID=113334 RepID=UPI000645376A|nr:ejaculatory bulb-specific protein 3-like [Melitaea cinxia]